MYLEALTDDQETTLSGERARLVRLCTRLTGDIHAAEDLAQDALLIAMQQEHSLREPEKRAQWLSGIARNLCLHWRRRRGLERHWSQQPRMDEGATTDRLDELAADFDLEHVLEQSELAELLSRALALLPADTREVLVQRYLHEATHTEVAARLALSEDVVKKRAERGKTALKRLLATDLQSEALAFGLARKPADAWQETRIWCPGPGLARGRGRRSRLGPRRADGGVRRAGGGRAVRSLPRYYRRVDHDSDLAPLLNCTPGCAHLRAGGWTTDRAGDP